eukprot:gene15034-16587_t
MANLVKGVMMTWDRFFHTISYMPHDDVDKLAENIKLVHRCSYLSVRAYSRKMQEIKDKLTEEIASCKMRSYEDADRCYDKTSRLFRLGCLKFEREYLNASEEISSSLQKKNGTKKREKSEKKNIRQVKLSAVKEAESKMCKDEVSSSFASLPSDNSGILHTQMKNVCLVESIAERIIKNATEKMAMRQRNICQTTNLPAEIRMEESGVFSMQNKALLLEEDRQLRSMMEDKRDHGNQLKAMMIHEEGRKIKREVEEFHANAKRIKERYLSRKQCKGENTIASIEYRNKGAENDNQAENAENKAPPPQSMKKESLRNDTEKRLGKGRKNCSQIVKRILIEKRLKKMMRAKSRMTGQVVGQMPALATDQESLQETKQVTSLAVGQMLALATDQESLQETKQVTSEVVGQMPALATDQESLQETKQVTRQENRLMVDSETSEIISQAKRCIGEPRSVVEADGISIEPSCSKRKRGENEEQAINTSSNEKEGDQNNFIAQTAQKELCMEPLAKRVRRGETIPNESGIEKREASCSELKSSESKQFAVIYTDD